MTKDDAFMANCNYVEIALATSVFLLAHHILGLITLYGRCSHSLNCTLITYNFNMNPSIHILRFELLYVTGYIIMSATFWRGKLAIYIFM